jgi:hypothetical protein
MKKVLSSATLLLFFTLVPNPVASQEKVNLTGIWEGSIYIADIDIDMELMLVLTERDGIISGRITDDWGYLNCDITEPNRENNVLTFKALVETSSDNHQMSFKMIISKAKMEGQWESLGSFGSWTAQRKNEDDEKNKLGFKIKDILGIWEGPAAFKSSPGSKRILTLVLEEKDGTLSGTFSDETGTKYTQVVITNFHKNNLILDIFFQNGDREFEMNANMTLKDASHMKGKFKIPEMKREGIWKAEKKVE